jgi:hypothetical protein
MPPPGWFSVENAAILTDGLCSRVTVCLIQSPASRQPKIRDFDFHAPVLQQDLEIQDVHDAVARKGRGNVKVQFVLPPVFDQHSQIFDVDPLVAVEVAG